MCTNKNKKELTKVTSVLPSVSLKFVPFDITVPTFASLSFALSSAGNKARCFWCVQCWHWV